MLGTDSLWEKVVTGIAAAAASLVGGTVINNQIELIRHEAQLQIVGEEMPQINQRLAALEQNAAATATAIVYIKDGVDEIKEEVKDDQQARNK